MDDNKGVNLDCRGMKCPRPIIELARARRNASPGTIISIIADDLAFESDVKAWCQTTGNKIIDFDKEENTVKASIEICGVK
jgi:TusA-related sulfurtransferase